jgi:hypothetical protein
MSSTSRNLNLKGKSHQCRIQHNWQKQMTPPNHAHGINRHKIRNLPAVWYERAKCQNTHPNNTEQANRKTVLEPLQHARHFNKEVGEFGFLGRRAPLHVVLEHVCEKRRGHVQGETAEEDGEHEDPFEVFEERGEESVGAETVAEDGEGDVAEACEDDHDGEPAVVNKRTFEMEDMYVTYQTLQESI